MKKITLIAAITLVGAMLFTSCKNNPYKGYSKTDSGMFYKHLIQGEGEQVKVGDIVEVTMVVIVNDTVVFDGGEETQRIAIQAPAFTGDIMEGLASMRVGDSSLFVLRGEDLKKQMQAPADQEMDDQVFAFKVVSIYSEEEALNNYLSENNINVEPTENGVYVVTTKKGSGKTPQAGDLVKANYIGRTLSGKLFDTSLEAVAKENDLFQPGRTYEPLEFQVGVGQMIPGFDEGVMLMKKGGKATLIFPSSLGYGGQDLSQIGLPPYSPLVFEVELVSVN